MGLIREPLDVDFTVDPRVLSKEERSAISEYIRAYKAKENEKSSAPATNKKVVAGKRMAVKH
jgi:hypothetical protein